MVHQTSQEGRRQKAEGRRQEAGSRRQEAEGRRKESLHNNLFSIFSLVSDFRYAALVSWQQMCWRLVMIIVISSGVVSCAISSQEEFRWNKYTSVNHPQVAQVINQASQPLLLSNSLEIMSLSYLLEPKVQFNWLTRQPVEMPNGEIRKQLVIPKITDSFSDVFLYNPSRQVLDEFDKRPNYKVELVNKWEQKLEPVYDVKASLWELTKK